MWDEGEKKFRFCEGAVMTNILLADEINRTSPRTQSALLQAMEEGCVSEDGKTYLLRKPFTVIATQNPLGSAGTMPLPPSQLDRFMLKLSLGRPTADELSSLLITLGEDSSSREIRQVCGREELLEMQADAAKVYLSEPIAKWVSRLVEATHESEFTLQGLSPRGAISLVNAAKAAAYFEGRDYVLPTDISMLFADSAAHRLVISAAGTASGLDGTTLSQSILKDNPPPHIKGAAR
jgi:MoxR-like ATPase